MEILITGLLLGLMGSFHCVGMCGPIAISLPLHGNSFAQKAFGGILYNLGRTLTYGLMGAVFGLIGQGFQLMGFQKWISIAMGALMVLSVLLPSVFKKINLGNKIPFTSWLRRGIQKLFAKRSYGGLFLIGLLNGFLPCGLVYMAIAGSIGTADLYYGIAFMILFGLGTLPMLLAVTLMGNLISISFRNSINKVIPYVVVVIGLLFILRGLSLGIPFISPPQEKLTPATHMQSSNEKGEPEENGRPCCGSD